jgi:hypothetical protein
VRAQAQLPGRWRKVRLNAGSKGPKVVRVLEAWVGTKDEEGRSGRRQREPVIGAVDREPRPWYTLSNAPCPVPLKKAVAVHSQLYGMEDC